jgi:hypothetical protein
MQEDEYREIMMIHDIISINTLHLSMGKFVDSIQIALENDDAECST